MNQVNHSISLKNLLFILLQFAGLTWMVYELNIEQELGLSYFFLITLIAFPIHSLVKKSARSWVQLIWFLSTLFLFLDFREGLCVLLLVGIYFAILSFDIPKWLRWSSLSLLTLYLFVCRFGFIDSPFTLHTLVTTAGLLMFRSILYSYDLLHLKVAVPWITKINYFLIAPNIIFPLFPILDYSRFLKSNYELPADKIYQKGINLILWAIICLLVYRVIYYFVIPDTLKLKGIWDVSQYFTGTYLTVIRLIGILSLGVGFLRLFGYHLPEIFNFMFLANGFSDIFRRINLYWKDFIMKMGYYPMYFRLRKKNLENKGIEINYMNPDPKGGTISVKNVITKNLILICLVWAFILTWFFHIYQWAWILGNNPVRGTGIVYWAVFGALAIWGSLREQKNVSLKLALSYHQSLAQANRIAFTFLGMSILYTLWVHASFDQWWVYFRIAATSTLQDWLFWFLALSGLIFIISLVHYFYNKSASSFSHFSILSHKWITPIIILLLSAFAYLKPGRKKEYMDMYYENQVLNKNDNRQQNEGYYESILRADVSSKLWDDDIDLALLKRKESLFRFFTGISDKVKSVTGLQNPQGEYSNLYQLDPFIQKRFKSNFIGKYKSKPLRTNDLGCRDTTYTKHRNSKTTRIVLIGASPDMGYGMSNDEFYEPIVEREINEILQEDSLEIINFSFPDQGLLSKVYTLEYLVLQYKPDYCILVEHFQKADRENDRLERILRDKGTLFTSLRVELDRLQINDQQIRTRQLDDKKYDHLYRWAYHKIATRCKESNIKPMLMYIPNPGVLSGYDTASKLFSKDEFEFIDFKEIYSGLNTDTLRLSPKDNHPNLAGHRVIADKFKAYLMGRLGLK